MHLIRLQRRLQERSQQAALCSRPASAARVASRSCARQQPADSGVRVSSRLPMTRRCLPGRWEQSAACECRPQRHRRCSSCWHRLIVQHRFGAKRIDHRPQVIPGIEGADFRDLQIVIDCAGASSVPDPSETRTESFEIGADGSDHCDAPLVVRWRFTDAIRRPRLAARRGSRGSAAPEALVSPIALAERTQGRGSIGSCVHRLALVEFRTQAQRERQRTRTDIGRGLATAQTRSAGTAAAPPLRASVRLVTPRFSAGAPLQSGRDALKFSARLPETIDFVVVGHRRKARLSGRGYDSGSGWKTGRREVRAVGQRRRGLPARRVEHGGRPPARLVPFAAV